MEHIGICGEGIAFVKIIASIMDPVLMVIAPAAYNREPPAFQSVYTERVVTMLSARSSSQEETWQI